MTFTKNRNIKVEHKIDGKINIDKLLIKKNPKPNDYKGKKRKNKDFIKL